MPFIENVAGRNFKATAVEAALTQSKAGNAMIKVTFQLLEPPHTLLVWNGMLHSEKMTARTLDSLRYAGWKGDDLSLVTFPSENEVSLTLENEEYEGKQHTKVAWVNKAGDSGFKVKSDLAPAEQMALAAKLKGAVLAHKAKEGHQQGNTNPPF